LTFLGFTQKIKKKVNVETSVVIWTGYKVTGQHEGTITLKEGVLLFENETLRGGNFIIDMTTINTTDLQGGSKDRLDGHLKDEDFFDVDKHKTASMSFKDVKLNGSSYLIEADLTIKGINKTVNFEMNVSGNTATADLKIDRTKFNITYKSASLSNIIKDKAIYDEFDLSVKLEF
jgi:polyisoprenoid-binding protein YceI